MAVLGCIGAVRRGNCADPLWVGRADPVPPAYFSDLLSIVLFLDHQNDLLVRKSFRDSSALLLGGLSTNMMRFRGTGLGFAMMSRMFCALLRK